MITAVSVAWHALREPSVTHPAAPSFRRTPRSPVIIHAATVFPSPGLIAKITLGIRREGIGSGASQKRRDGGAHASLSLSLSLPPALLPRAFANWRDRAVEVKASEVKASGISAWRKRKKTEA